MKNFFKTTLYLFVFASAGILFQISCSNSESASQLPQSTTTNKLIYYKISGGLQNGIWTCNYDGSNETQVPITLPANVVFSGNTVKISPDGQKIFFLAGSIGSNVTSVYSCDIDGNNLQPILSATWPDGIELSDLN
ncbi:hypothetical protein SAMN05444377_11734 [Flavobacterium fontis]|uniref:WD40-like Beta Propeller Repeat n=1 Tax=Flavobacterium fontis TaxID=1124188 RepID=A0A1M5E1V9_9FLAO|nr:hypothetical protein [Flavobacterium fontis]SHF73248.1 hypothetical protein SAMN05444377_11734 [Flavobacterium fontis]